MSKRSRGYKRPKKQWTIDAVNGRFAVTQVGGGAYTANGATICQTPGRAYANGEAQISVGSDITVKHVKVNAIIHEDDFISGESILFYVVYIPEGATFEIPAATISQNLYTSFFYSRQEYVMAWRRVTIQNGTGTNNNVYLNTGRLKRTLHPGDSIALVAMHLNQGNTNAEQKIISFSATYAFTTQ